MRRSLLSVALLLAATASAAQDADYASLVQSLRAEKISIKQEGEIEQPFFAVTGRVISLYGDHIQIFEYPSRAKADAEAARVAPDGMTVGTTKPHWLAPPHFYKKDRIVVLYLGNDEKVLKALESRLGRQFAGG